VTPDNVAKALHLEGNPYLRHAVLMEIASRWGGAAAQATLEAERRLNESSAPAVSPQHGEAQMSPAPTSAHATTGPAPHQVSTPSSAHGAHGDATVADHANAAHDGAHAGVAIDSAIAQPPVSAGASPAPQRASEAAPAYLSIGGNTASASEKQADDIKRIEYIYETAQQTGNGILGSLVPGYLAARDQCDASAVAELGGRLVGAFSVVHGAKAALDQMLKTLPRHSVPGTSPDDGLALAATLQAVEAKAPLLIPLLLTVDAMIATTMTPHVFHGSEVAGQAVVVSLDGPPMQRTAKLTGELQRTVGMLVLVDSLKTQLLEGKKGLDRASLQAARSRLMPWASRPLDLAFLRAVLGPIWELLDATTSPIESKPSDVLTDATKQAKHTGWLGDVGQVDINNACNELRIGRRENAEFVIRQLYTADPDTRARLLIQIKERGLLDALCSAVGWADIKELHDSLGSGFSEIKTDLQHYFLIGKDGYGPDLGHEWERHDSSLHGLVARLGGAGTVLNFALDVGTFGFNSSYGKALDDRSEGRTSEGEASHDKMHAAGRTAAIAALSMLTGGLADKLVRGGAATVSTIRAVGAGAAGGSVGGVSALGASDAYGNYVSGDQERFSSPEEYVKAALLGGAIGGAVGGVTQGLSDGAAAKLPRASELAAPAEGRVSPADPASVPKENFEYGVDSGGRRNDAPLTPAQIDEALTYARELGVPDDAIHLVDESNTSWGRMFGEERLHVGTDVAPSTSPRWRAASANSRISVKGAVAHEVVGHRAADIAGRTQAEVVLEEAQASIRAARFAPQLSPIERLTLIRDAVERLHRAGYRVSDVRDTLWIGTP
jgi:hypothetical protein